MKVLDINAENAELLLSEFNKKLNEKGFIVDSETGSIVHCHYTGKPLNLDSLGGILPGSEIFIEDSDAAYAAYIAEQLSSDES